MSTLLQDFPFGLRVLAKHPGFTVGCGCAKLEESPDLQFGGIKNRKAFEVSAVEAPVAREQAVGLKEGVGSDQKVCCNSISLPPLLPVRLPGSSGLKRGFDAERAILDSHFGEHLLRRAAGRKISGNFRPDDIAGHDSPCGNTGLEGLPGAQAERGVAGRKVEDNAAIDGGDHLGIPLRGARA